MTLLAADPDNRWSPSALGSDVRLPQRTVGRYLELLEEVFLIKRVPAWSRNLSARAIGTPAVLAVSNPQTVRRSRPYRQPSVPPLGEGR